MIRKFKTLGIAVVSVLAMSAVLASVAQAAGTATVSAGTTSYTATQTEGNKHTFTLPGNRVLSCSTATFAGEISDGSDTTEATPTYDNCTITVGGSTLPATVDENSCEYHFALGEPSGGVWPATTKVQCSGSEKIEIRVYSSEANHAAGTTLCHYTVAAQTVGSGVTFRNASEIGIKATEVAVAYTRVSGTTTNCGGASGTAFYNGDTEATAASGTLAIH